MTTINIVPVPIEKIIHKVSISIDVFTLNATEGTATIYKLTEDDKLIDIVSVPIPTEIWQAWGQDDSFITTYILLQLGYTAI